MAVSLASLDPAPVALGALAVQVLFAELGYRLARHVTGPGPAPDAVRSQASALQAAILGLLGLLLAFSFSMAVERYEQRRGLVVAESNAIGTAWLRADALPEPDRAITRDDLRRYVDARLAYFDAGEDRAAIRAAVARAEALHATLWQRAAADAAAAPDDVGRALLLEALNDVIDLAASRLAAHDAHVPDSIVALLVGVAAGALGTVGYAFGLAAGRYRVGCVLLAFLVTAILYVVLDLDQPRRGRIRVSQATMRDLRDTLDVPDTPRVE